jgi:hypothetical protein
MLLASPPLCAGRSGSGAELTAFSPAASSPVAGAAGLPRQAAAAASTASLRCSWWTGRARPSHVRGSIRARPTICDRCRTGLARSRAALVVHGGYSRNQVAERLGLCSARCAAVATERARERLRRGAHAYGLQAACTGSIPVGASTNPRKRDSPDARFEEIELGRRFVANVAADTSSGACGGGARRPHRRRGRLLGGRLGLRPGCGA